MLLLTSRTGIEVARASSWVSALACAGSKCCTSTNPMPVSSGRCCSKCVHASRPPADAPMPTIGNRTAVRADDVTERRFESLLDWWLDGDLSPGFCFLPAEPELGGPDPEPGADSFWELAFGRVPDCFSAFDLNWALSI